MPAAIAPAPPRPRAHPVLGSALDLRRSQIRTYEQMMREHGDVVRLMVGPPGVRFPLYCVFHSDGVRAVLAGSRQGYSQGNRFCRQIAQAFGWEREGVRHPHAYFPFGGGPRACIGSHFAMLEAIIAVALLLQRFQIRSEQERVPLDTEGITLRPRGVVPVQPAVR
jgi:cytochrome P450